MSYQLVFDDNGRVAVRRPDDSLANTESVTLAQLAPLIAACVDARVLSALEEQDPRKGVDKAVADRLAALKQPQGPEESAEQEQQPAPPTPASGKALLRCIKAFTLDQPLPEGHSFTVGQEIETEARVLLEMVRAGYLERITPTPQEELPVQARPRRIPSPPLAPGSSIRILSDFATDDGRSFSAGQVIESCTDPLLLEIARSGVHASAV